MDQDRLQGSSSPVGAGCDNSQTQVSFGGFPVKKEPVEGSIIKDEPVDEMDDDSKVSQEKEHQEDGEQYNYDSSSSDLSSLDDDDSEDEDYDIDHVNPSSSKTKKKRKLSGRNMNLSRKKANFGNSSSKDAGRMGLDNIANPTAKQQGIGKRYFDPIEERERNQKYWTLLFKGMADEAPLHLQEHAFRDAENFCSWVHAFRNTLCRNESGEEKVQRPWYYDHKNKAFKIHVMNGLLYFHQFEAVAFIAHREKLGRRLKTELYTPENVPSGLICHLPGLGKTRILIATMQLTWQRVKRGANLVIVPNRGLINQWNDEIDDCLAGFWQSNQGICILAQVAADCDAKSLKQMLSKSFIILATYDEVREHAAILAKIPFLRIILDEGHVIKNPRSKTAQILEPLRAKHRWIMTGTPLNNGPDEMYSYFKFFKLPGTESLRHWHRKYPSNKNGLARQGDAFAKLCLKRDYESVILGRAITEMPFKNYSRVMLPQDQMTREILRIVTIRYKERIKMEEEARRKLQLDMSNGGTWSTDNSSEYSPVVDDENVLGTQKRMIVPKAWLALRHIESHPYIAETELGNILSKEDIQTLLQFAINLEKDENSKGDDHTTKNILEMRDQIAQVVKKDMDQAVKEYLCEAMQRNSEEEMEKYKKSVPSTYLRKPDDIETGGPYGEVYRYSEFFSHILNVKEAVERAEDQGICKACDQAPISLYQLSCGCHTCHPCFKRLTKPTQTCHTCHQKVNKAQPKFINLPKTNHKKAKQRECLPQSYVETIQNIADISWSTKTLAIKATILNWIAQDPDCKIIVFSQHLKLLEILEKLCQLEGWSCCMYHGGVDQDTRPINLLEFKGKKGQILLATTKSGGFGLNIIQANRVLITDPWWNTANTLQAFNRIFRIGQTRTCELVEIVCQGSVEEYMSRLQEKKQFKLDVTMKADNTKNLQYQFFSQDIQRDDGGNIIGTKHAEDDPYGVGGYLIKSGITLRAPTEKSGLKKTDQTEESPTQCS